MKNRMHSIVALAAVFTFAASVALAGEGANFVSGNKNNDGKYTPRTVIRPSSDDPNRQPGFWDKEWKRSGLGQVGGGKMWNPFAEAGGYLKKKDDAYRAKHPAGADTVSAS